MRIGEFLVERGVLTEGQVQDILTYAQRHHIRFGDAGIELKLLSTDKMVEVFGPSYNVDFFHLSPDHFPASTKEILPIDLMLKYGALPLGFKTDQNLFNSTRLLNLGLLNPERIDARAEIEGYLKSNPNTQTVAGTKVFLVLADQYLGVLRKLYGLTDDGIRKRGPAQLDPILVMFLERS